MIQADNTSGAVDMTIQAAEVLKSTPMLETTALGLVRAQPQMAPIFNLCNQALLAQPDMVRTVVDNYIKSLKKASKAIGAIANTLIEDGQTIMTHSYSSTVRDTLLTARRLGKHNTVICTESRPMNEGVTLARHLAEADIQVQLIVDAAMFQYLPQVDLILFGADTVYPKKVVNKIGSSILAFGARESKVNAFTLASTHKFLPVTSKPERLRDPAEILPIPIPGIQVLNYYFEETSLDYLQGVVTETKILHPGQMIQSAFRAIEVYPGLIAGLY